MEGAGGRGRRSTREYVGRVNYKCVVGASENAKLEDGRTRTDGRRGRQGERRRRFWVERVFSGRTRRGRTRWRWISSARAFVRSFSTHTHSQGRVASSSFPAASPLFLPSSPACKRLNNLRARERDSRPFISLRVNSLNRQRERERWGRIEGERVAQERSE